MFDGRKRLPSHNDKLQTRDISFAVYASDLPARGVVRTLYGENWLQNVEWIQ